VDHESVAVLSRRSKRVTHLLPQKGRPVSWKCGMSFSPSPSTKLAQIDKRPTTDFCGQTSIAQIGSTRFGVFPRLFAAFNAYLSSISRNA
jgi:hypothetical protein